MHATDIIPEGTFSDLPDIVIEFMKFGFTEFSPVLKIIVGVSCLFFVVRLLTR